MFKFFLEWGITCNFGQNSAKISKKLEKIKNPKNMCQTTSENCQNFIIWPQKGQFPNPASTYTTEKSLKRYRACTLALWRHVDAVMSHGMLCSIQKCSDFVIQQNIWKIFHNFLEICLKCNLRYQWMFWQIYRVLCKHITFWWITQFSVFLSQLK